MRPLRLDFLHPIPPHSRLGPALLFAGALAAGVAGWRFAALDSEAQRLESRLAETQRMARRGLPAVRSPAADPKLVAQELGHANAILASLTVPWDAMFRSLESAAGDNVGLLGIQPDGSGRQVRIAGEARRFEDLIVYLKRLKSTSGFSNVFLAAHELKGSGNARTVAFTLTAEWSVPQ
ncbi:MAG: PilN domain-containing protein [Burkholderiales bacterium]